MRISLVALLAACSAALRCSPQYRPLAQRRCSIVAHGGAELATLPSQLGRVAGWSGKVVVVKYGGHAMTDPELSKSFAADCALMQSLGVRLVVVHGGGPQINAMLKKLEIKSEFVGGLRVTDSATMDVAEMVLCGSINKQIASSITLAGGRAVGLSGKDDKMVTAERKMHVDADGTEVSLGQVGEPGAVRTELLESLLESGIAPLHVASVLLEDEAVPVIAPVAIGSNGMSYNVNADTMSGAIAAALSARALLLLTDVAGVLDAAPEDGGKLLPTLSLDDVARLKAEGVITGGMIPKLETACNAVSGGCGSAVIMDGRVQHCTLQHFFGEGGVGTAVVESK